MTTMGFTKLDSGIVQSSIWSESLATRVLWVTMLAMANHVGFVGASRSGLVRTANIPEDDFDEALVCLSSPDPDSRTPEHDGRRIEKIDGGWNILNYRKYRDFTYSDSPEAIRKREKRQENEDRTRPDASGHSRTNSGHSASVICNLSSDSYSLQEDIKKEPKETPEQILEKRASKFYFEIDATDYPDEMKKAFFDYWTEPNPSKTKMRFEKETTWDLPRRLARWANNQKPALRQRFGTQIPTMAELKDQAERVELS
jgi:hypothetical protein